ncbi:MAG: pitrilysin family protein [bacterium]
MRPVTRLAALAAALALTACGSAAPLLDQAGSPRPSTPTSVGPRPALAAPAAFVPPVATVVEIPGAPPVWLVERHDVPLVALHVVVPYGAAADPAGQGGLAALTAEMMEQGAGRRGALELGQAAERLGADLTVDADRDASSARLVVLAENLEPALALLADVVARPRFEAEEWKRTHALWLAGIESRAFEPAAVAGVVTAAALYGAGHPYGHPVDGTLASVGRIDLAAVKAFHARHWRPDRAAIVVAGDVTAEQLRALLPPALAVWGATGAPPPLPTPPPAPASPPPTVLVERAESPQTMLLVARIGPAVGDAELPAVELVNIPLGATFTSRLNQNLREDKGYTYGARSRVPFSRGPGAVTAGAAVQSQVTEPALRELRGELGRMIDEGPTAAELVKARATAQSRDVEAYEEVAATADRLAELAGLGLAPDADARAAAARAAVDAAAAKTAAARLPTPDSMIVAVGDPAIVEAALSALGLPAPARFTPDGEPATPAAPKAGAEP